MVIERIVSRVASLLFKPGSTVLEQDLLALANGLIQGVFNELEEQLVSRSFLFVLSCFDCFHRRTLLPLSLFHSRRED
jgi:hypothetical protein